MKRINIGIVVGMVALGLTGCSSTGGSNWSSNWANWTSNWSKSDSGATGLHNNSESGNWPTVDAGRYASMGATAAGPSVTSDMSGHASDNSSSTIPARPR